MKPHPRIRKTIKWGGAVVTVLLVVVWVGSGWWSPQWKTTSGYGGNVTKGLLGIAKGEPIAAGWFRLVPKTKVNRHRFHWWFDYVSASEVANSSGSSVYVPVWLVVAPLSAITVIAWRADSRVRSVVREQSEIASNAREHPGVNAIVVVAVVGIILLVEWILQR